MKVREYGATVFALLALLAGCGDSGNSLSQSTDRATNSTVAESSDEFRAKITDEYAMECIKGIEDEPDLRAVYSHKTVEVYCVCRQRYRADVLAQAIKDDERGKAVSDRAAAYAHENCKYILLQGLEKE
ncbi:MAG: hypothetical protein LBE24_00340 [Methylobacillus sp.]|nr:hypothetical protein [Methylobacillus sp.]